jgi:small subunit ribosomal protein S9
MPEKSKKTKVVKIVKTKVPEIVKTEIPETEVEVVETKEKKLKKSEYIEAIGRRKRAVARVRIFTVSPTDSIEAGNFIVNGKNYKQYFPTSILQQTVESPFARLKSMNRFNGTVKVNGGGISGQAEAIRLGISRALVIFDINFRKRLKKIGFLKRDPREKERRKFGLKKARKAPQWSKR